MDRKIFTYVPEIDTYMLQQFDNKTLYTVCHVNSYAIDLCMSDKLLKKRLEEQIEFNRHQHFNYFLQYLNFIKQYGDERNGNALRELKITVLNDHRLTPDNRTVLLHVLDNKLTHIH